MHTVNIIVDVILGVLLAHQAQWHASNCFQFSFRLGKPELGLVSGGAESIAG